MTKKIKYRPAIQRLGGDPLPQLNDPDWWWSGMPYVALRDIQDEYADKDAILDELEGDDTKCKCEEPKKMVDSEEEQIICVKCWHRV